MNDDELLCMLSEREAAAVADLEALILQKFPEATFVVERDVEDPVAISLAATVDVENRWDLLDWVVERQMEILIDDGIPIYIIPIRTPERERAVVAALEAERAAALVAAEEHA